MKVRGCQEHSMLLWLKGPEPTVRTTENSTHIWHSFNDEYLLDPRAWVINVANWLDSYGSKKRVWWTTRWTLWEPRVIHTPVCWQILSLERFLHIKILAKARKVAQFIKIFNRIKKKKHHPEDLEEMSFWNYDKVLEIC